MKNLFTALLVAVWLCLGVRTAASASIWQQATQLNPYSWVTNNGTLAGATNKLTSYGTGIDASYPGVDKIYYFDVFPDYNGFQGTSLRMQYSGNIRILILRDSSAALGGSVLLSGTGAPAHNDQNLTVPVGRHYMVVECLDNNPGSFSFFPQATSLAFDLTSGALTSSGTPVCGQSFNPTLANNTQDYFGYYSYTVPVPYTAFNPPLLFTGQGKRKSFQITLPYTGYVQVVLNQNAPDATMALTLDGTSLTTLGYGHFATASVASSSFWITLTNCFFDDTTHIPFTVTCSPNPIPVYQNAKPYAVPLPASGLAQGTLASASNHLTIYTGDSLPPSYYGPLSFPVAYPGPEAVYKFTVPAARELFISRKASGHQLFLLDSTGNTRHTIPLNDNLSRTPVFPYYYAIADDYPNVLPLAAGTYYMAIEQASATVTDPYSFQLQTECVPTLSGGTGRVNNFVLNTNPNSHYGSLNFPGGTPGYSASGATYTLNAQTNNSIHIISEGLYYYRLFVDFNGDGDFDDVSELIYTNNLGQPIAYDNFSLSTGNSVYLGAQGKTLVARLVATAAASTVSPCGNLGGANVIDFFVRIPADGPLPTGTTDFRWTRMAGDAGNDNYTKVRTAPDGSLYACGNYQAVWDADYHIFKNNFQLNGLPGKGSVQGSTESKDSQPDNGVVARYGKDGSLLWAARLITRSFNIGSTSLEVTGLAVDKFGYGYATGYYYGGYLTIYPAIGASSQLASNYGSNAFVAKFHPDGHLVFAFSFGGGAGGSGSASITGIDVAPDLRFYISGYFTGSTTIQGSSGTAVTLTSRGNNDAFLAKFSDLGTLYWTIQAGGTGNDFAYGAAADITGGGYLMGSYESTATFNSTLYGAGSFSKTAVGGSDGFVLGVSQTGTLNWVASMGGSTNENVRDVAPDPRGTGVVAVGGFSQTAQFGPTTLNSTGYYDAFAVRLSNAGAFQWATKAGGFGQDQAYGVRLDHSGNPWVGLSFSQTMSSVFGGGSLTSQGGLDGALVRLDAATGLLSSPPIGQVKGPNDEQVLGIDTVTGGAVAAGSAQAGVQFGRLGVFGNVNASYYQNGAMINPTDGFLTRFSAPATGVAREALPEQAAALAPGLQAYPNPSQGSLTLQLAGLPDGNYPLFVTDAQGRRVHTQAFSAEELATGTRLSAALPAGFYTVQAAGKTCRVVVQ